MDNPISRRKFLLTSGLAIPGYMATPEFAFGQMQIRSNSGEGMKVGVDADKLYAVKNDGPFAVLEFARKHGFEGVFYRTMLDLSPDLDDGKLKEIKAFADSLGSCTFDSGFRCPVNPYND